MNGKACSLSGANPARRLFITSRRACGRGKMPSSSALWTAQPCLNGHIHVTLPQRWQETSPQRGDKRDASSPPPRRGCQGDTSYRLLISLMALARGERVVVLRIPVREDSFVSKFYTKMSLGIAPNIESSSQSTPNPFQLTPT